MKITVVVTLLNDKRVTRTLDSLVRQERRPDSVLVADGGSTDGTLEAVRAFADAHPWIRVAHMPGSVAETRNAAIADVLDGEPSGSDHAIVFLDADEIAPPHWLAALAAPLESGDADFTGGPTRPLASARSSAEQYLNDFEAWFYPNVVAHDVTRLPMGNSAWHARVFRAIGNFDARLTRGGEDYDVNVRAREAGFRGAFVADAWVHHDQSNVDSMRKLLRRKYRYNVGAAQAYLKNGVLRERAGGAVRTTTSFKHPVEWANLVIQPVALARAWLWWTRERRGHA